MTRPAENDALRTIEAAMKDGRIDPAMDHPDVIASLEVLACDIGARPKDAPVFGDIAPMLRGMRREPGALTLLFDVAAAEAVEMFAAAERACCSTLGFDVRTGESTMLRISAAEAQLDVMQAWMTAEAPAQKA